MTTKPMVCMGYIIISTHVSLKEAVRYALIPPPLSFVRTLGPAVEVSQEWQNWEVPGSPGDRTDCVDFGSGSADVVQGKESGRDLFWW